MEPIGLRGRNWPRSWALAALASLVVAGCVGATPIGSASRLPATSPTGTSPASASVTDTSSPTTPVTKSTAAADSLQSVSPAPSGTWKGIRWTSLPATSAVGANTLVAGSTFQVFGWSRGYIGFAITPGQPTADQAAADTIVDATVVSSYSTDGVHWHAGQKLDTVAAGSYDLQVIRSVIEGPAGLLAVGWSGSCGSEYLDSLWTSSDGIAWQPVDAKKVFGTASDFLEIVHVSGGAAGYVAVAYKSAGAWTSKDGRSWKRVPLGAGSFKNSQVNDGTAISGGFVLAGTTGTRDCGAAVSMDDSTPPPVFRTASVWWSADSSSWTRISLPGAMAKSEYQSTWVCRLNDRAMLVVDDSGAGRSAWASKNGRTWTVVNLPGDIVQPGVISDGQHNLVVAPTLGTDSQGYPVAVLGDLGLRTIDDGFAVVSMAQSGDVPQLVYSNWYYGPYGMVALGPTGVVATNAGGSQLWFGSPSAK
jgi:hypothetical protein